MQKKEYYSESNKLYKNDPENYVKYLTTNPTFLGITDKLCE